MRVLHVIHSVLTKSGGPIAGLTRIAESCRGLGYHVEVACLNDPEKAREDDLAGAANLIERYLALSKIELDAMGERALGTFNARYNIQNCGREILSLFEAAHQTRARAGTPAFTPPAVRR